jgi:hypothetical protein
VQLYISETLQLGSRSLLEMLEKDFYMPIEVSWLLSATFLVAYSAGPAFGFRFVHGSTPVLTNHNFGVGMKLSY